MLEFLLQREIDRRVKDEIGATDYYAEPVMLRVDTPKFRKQLEGSLYFLVSEKLSVPVASRIIIESPDNIFSSSQMDFEQLNTTRLQSFRNNLSIKLENYGTFVPYTLEFLKVTPTAVG